MKKKKKKIERDPNSLPPQRNSHSKKKKNSVLLLVKEMRELSCRENSYVWDPTHLLPPSLERKDLPASERD